MKKFKSTNGFTLVELIVVIAILAILAGIAVPAYSGYITKAKDAAVVTELDAIKTAAFAIEATDDGGVPESIEVLVTTGEGGTKTISYKIGDVEYTSLAPYYEGTPSLADTSYEDGAKWENGEWSAQ